MNYDDDHTVDATLGTRADDPTGHGNQPGTVGGPQGQRVRVRVSEPWGAANGMRGLQRVSAGQAPSAVILRFLFILPFTAVQLRLPASPPLRSLPLRLPP